MTTALSLSSCERESTGSALRAWLMSQSRLKKCELFIRGFISFNGHNTLPASLENEVTQEGCISEAGMESLRGKTRLLPRHDTASHCQNSESQFATHGAVLGEGTHQTASLFANTFKENTTKGRSIYCFPAFRTARPAVVFRR